MIPKVKFIVLGSGITEGSKIIISKENKFNITVFRILFPKGISFSSIFLNIEYSLKKKISVIKKRKFQILYIFKILYLLIKLRNNYDIVHVHGLFWYPIAFFSSFFLKKKTMGKITLMNDDDPSSLLKSQFRLVKKLMINRFNKIICISLETYLSSIKVLDRSKLIHLSNGVDTTKFKPPNDIEEIHKIKSKYNIPTNKSIFLFVGNMGHRKGILKLLDVWSHVSDNFFLILVGPIKKELNENFFLSKIKFINTNNKKITHLGFLRDTSDLYKISNIFITFSEYEGQPNAVLEALSSGLPIVALKKSWISGLLNDSNSFLLLDSSTKGLATQINNLSIKTNPEMRENIRKDTIKKYSIQNIAIEYFNIYQDLYDPKLK